MAAEVADRYRLAFERIEPLLYRSEPIRGDGDMPAFLHAAPGWQPDAAPPGHDLEYVRLNRLVQPGGGSLLLSDGPSAASFLRIGGIALAGCKTQAGVQFDLTLIGSSGGIGAGPPGGGLGAGSPTIQFTLEVLSAALVAEIRAAGARQAAERAQALLRQLRDAAEGPPEAALDAIDALRRALGLRR